MDRSSNTVESGRTSTTAPDNLPRRLLSGAALRVAILVANAIVSFFMMPFLIKHLGDRWYGLWILVGTLTGYYGFLEVGLSSAVSRFVSRAFGRRDFEEINIVVNTALVLFSIAGAAVLVLAALVAASCSRFTAQASDLSLFRAVILTTGLGVAVGFPFRAFAGVLASKLRYDLLSFVQFGQLALRTTLIVVAFTSGRGLVALALINLFVDVVGYGVYFIIVRHEMPELQLSKGYFRRARVRQLFNYSKFSFLSQLADQLRFRVDSLVLAAFVALGAVTHYFVASRILDYFIQFIVAAVGLMSPVFSRYEGTNDLVTLRARFLDVSRISAVLAVFVGGMIVTYGREFIRAWMGPEYSDSYLVLLIIVIPTVIALMQNPSIGLLYGISKHKFFAYANAAEGVLNLGLSLILVRVYGMYGVALGTAISMALFKVIVQPLYVCRAAGIGWRSYYLDALLGPALKTLVPILMVGLATRGLAAQGYPRLLLLGLVEAALVLPVAYYWVLDVRQRALIGRGLGIVRSE